MDDYWLQVAKGLMIMCSTKITCCKDDKSMKVYHTEDGYSSHCFRCGEHSFVPHGICSISELAKMEADKQLIMMPELTLPLDFTKEIPSNLLIWFLNVGVTAYMVKANGIGYSPSLDRIIMPIHVNGQLSAIQTRSLNRVPKYLTVGTTAGKLYCPFTYAYTEYVVIVEDILSSIKISRIALARSTLGTKFSDSHALELKRMKKHVILWYDPDYAGDTAVQVAQRKLSLLGVSCSVLKSKEDPKYYSCKNIQERIDKCLT